MPSSDSSRSSSADSAVLHDHHHATGSGPTTHRPITHSLARTAGPPPRGTLPRDHADTTDFERLQTRALLDAAAAHRRQQQPSQPAGAPGNRTNLAPTGARTHPAGPQSHPAQHQRPHTRDSNNTATTGSSQPLSLAELSSLASDDPRRNQPAVANLQSYMQPFGTNAPRPHNPYQTRHDDHVGSDAESDDESLPRYSRPPTYVSDRPSYHSTQHPTVGRRAPSSSDSD